ncbi:rCG33773 [Rattus norvegicus]|uniref:RCG33773 n=1 Tax=Rattus norvegicus TaxID=10116 RepID=A6HHE0_RAT|nr:rCG33773 [Rattus norvegicus]
MYVVAQPWKCEQPEVRDAVSEHCTLTSTHPFPQSV